jgi:hypothetical protein
LPDDDDMNDNGSFRKKGGFTITGNTVTRDQNLSLKAKGLYLLISSYITMDTLDLTKGFILSKCKEGNKAMNSAWIELKKSGYLKVYMRPVNGSWQVEYELLDIADCSPHTIYLTALGDLSSTNIDKKKLDITKTPDTEIFDDGECCTQKGSNGEHYTQKGSNGEHYTQKGSNAYRDNGNGGDNIITFSNTSSNTIFNNLSINPKVGMSDEEILKIFEIEKKIPTEFMSHRHQIQIGIHYFSEWNERLQESDSEACKLDDYKLLVEALIEMCSEDIKRTYKGSTVSALQVLDRVNGCIKDDRFGKLGDFIDSTLDDFYTATRAIDVKALKNYMKACIWNSFSTYRVKNHAFFERTYNKRLLAN